MAEEIEEAIEAERARVIAALQDVFGKYSAMQHQILDIVGSFVGRSLKSVKDENLGQTSTTAEEAVSKTRRRVLEYFDYYRRGDSLPEDLVDSVRRALEDK